jgi:hypothetical protein
LKWKISKVGMRDFSDKQDGSRASGLAGLGDGRLYRQCRDDRLDQSGDADATGDLRNNSGPWLVKSMPFGSSAGKAQSILFSSRSQIDYLTETVKGASTRGTGLLRIGDAGVLTTEVIAPALRRLRKHWPNLRLSADEALWQLAENFLFERFLRTTPIVAGRRNDSKNVSFDAVIIFELFMLRLQLWSCNK